MSTGEVGDDASGNSPAPPTADLMSRGPSHLDSRTSPKISSSAKIMVFGLVLATTGNGFAGLSLPFLSLPSSTAVASRPAWVRSAAAAELRIINPVVKAGSVEPDRLSPSLPAMAVGDRADTSPSRSLAPAVPLSPPVLARGEGPIAPVPPPLPQGSQPAAADRPPSSRHFVPPGASNDLHEAAEALNRAISEATTPAALLELQTRGAERSRVEARLAALGYVEILSAGERLYRKPGDADPFRDCGTCPELVVVPAGRAIMRVTVANSVREISIDVPRPIAVARHETTRGEFARFIAETGYVIPAGCYARRPTRRVDPAFSWRNPGYIQADDHPVVCVSLEDASAFADWMSQKTGYRYRLPSDAEWHVLASAEAWPARVGPELCLIGNGADQSAGALYPDWDIAACTDGYIHTAPVGRFKAGAQGLYDLNGNVWEWVNTCAPERAVDAEFPPRQCRPGAARILRGASFADPPSMRLLDARIVGPPATRDQLAGFRLVREVD